MWVLASGQVSSKQRVGNMAAPKRGKLERERDMARIVELHREGYNQTEIAEALGVCQQQVSYDIRQMRRRWRDQAMLGIAMMTGELLEYHKGIIRQVYMAWHQSKTGRRLVDGPPLPDGSPGPKVEVEVPRLPEVDYLKVAQASLSAMAALVADMEVNRGGKVREGGSEVNVSVGVWNPTPVAGPVEEADPVEVAVAALGVADREEGSNGKAPPASPC